jgi:hypothetical protein
LWLPRRPWLPAEDAVDRGTPYWWQSGGIGWVVFDRLIYPALMLFGDLVWFVISLPFTITGRFVLRRPWRIQAATIGRPRMTREIDAAGWRGSREAIEDLAAEIASGS